MTFLRYSMALGTAATLGAPMLAPAAELQLSLALPHLDVAEYRHPYVAVWVQPAGGHANATTLAVWYDLKKRDNGGTKWLKDLRTWWREGGRALQLPADGVSGATRAPGEHKLSFPASRLASLAPGDYVLTVEVAREDGGREVQRLPFQWPAREATAVRASGDHELGPVSLEVRP